MEVNNIRAYDYLKQPYRANPFSGMGALLADRQ
jgi:hypothetical protein